MPNPYGTFSLAQSQPAWVPSNASAGGGGGLGALAGVLGAATPLGPLAASAPALAQGVLGIIGGLAAPSQRTQNKWQREHLEKLAKQRLGMADKYMKPKYGYAEEGGKNMAGLGELLKTMLSKKAAMYTGTGTGAPWATAMQTPRTPPPPQQEMLGQRGPAMPQWAESFNRRG